MFFVVFYRQVQGEDENRTPLKVVRDEFKARIML